jgi:alpha-L-rhamnosidase
MLRAQNLTVDHYTNPVGFGGEPVFGWTLASDRRNVVQTMFRFQLSSAADFSCLLYDSGEVASARSVAYRPDGLRLRPATRYWWRVSVIAEPGGMSALSEPATFVTSLLGGDWGAAFVSAETAADAMSSAGTFVRGRFTAEGEIKAAYAFSTALGLYHLYLNGEKAGQDELAPGWTSYNKRLLYQAYDITGLVKQGENTVSAMLGAGWYKGEMGFLHGRNNYGAQTALLARIEIEYTDGRRQTAVSDGSWEGADSPVLFSEIYDGETVDARIEPRDWAPVSIVPYPQGNLEEQPGCRIKAMESLPAQKLFVTPAGETVLDFGQNLTGWVRFFVTGSAGDTVVLRFFEVLDKEGNVYTANLRKARQTIHYTLRGSGTEAYRPYFTFQGFRYAWVEKYPGEVKIENFVARAVRSDMPDIGVFECSHPLLNGLNHNIAWSLKGNFLDVPTDCPQRDERMGWTGDAQIFSSTACHLTGAYPFFRKWLRDLAADQTAEGGVPHVVPDIITGHKLVMNNWLLSQGTHSAAAWGDAAVIIPYELYCAYGDRRILIEQYASMKAWINFMREHADGVIWNYKLQFGDWVALDAAEGSYLGATPNDLSCTAWYACSTKLFAKIAGILGHTEDCDTYSALHERIVSGFRERFYTQDGELTAQTQTAHILALRFDLVADENRGKTVAGLLRLLDKENGHLVTGFMGTPFFTGALSDNGKLAEAYALLLKEDFPSWLYQVKAGATTVWEHWDGIKPDGSMWSPDMNSFNHYANGAVGAWMYRVIAGIAPDENAPGYRRAIIHPRPGGGLTHASASQQTPYGELSVAWRVRENQVELNLVIPCNAGAAVCLDASGVPETDGLVFIRRPDGFYAEAGSGTYRVRYIPA